jgi:hypothetical protein
MRMTPEAERVHARLLRYTDHRADRGLAMAAAKLILEQAEEFERLKAGLAANEGSPRSPGNASNWPE